MLKIYFYVLTVILLVSSCSVHKLSKKGVYKEVNAKEYAVYVNDSIVNIIDVRTLNEYNKTHIKGAVNIPYFGGNFKKKLKKQKLDTSLTTLIYCETQHRSLFVANKLYKTGFTKIIDLDKGMRKWRKDKFPFISSTQK